MTEIADDHAGRLAQPLPHPAPQGQAGQPLQRVERDRAPGGPGAAGRRGGAGRARHPGDGHAYAARLRDRLDAFAAALRYDLGRIGDAETEARRIVERLALAFQGSLLVRHAPAAVAGAFCATRLAGEGGRAFGTLPAGTDFGAILERHDPGL